MLTTVTKNTPELVLRDGEILKKLQDAPLAQYLLEIALASETLARLKMERAANTIQRAWLLLVIHKTLRATLVERRELQKDWTETKTNLEESIQNALQIGNYTQVARLSERLQVTQEHYQAELAALECVLTPEAKAIRLTYLSQRTAQLSQAMQRQGHQLVDQAIALAKIERNLVVHTQAGIEALKQKAQPKRPIMRVVPSIYLPQPKTVDGKAQSVANAIPLEMIKAYLTAVYRGELQKVEEFLKLNPQLVYAQGDLTDLSKRTFTRITGFQYAVWALDGPMWDVILNCLPKEDAAAQIQAYEGRKDLISLHGLRYSFDKLLAEYDNYIKNCDGWDYDRCCHHWQKGVGAAQAMMPSWLIYAFTEPGASVAWVKGNVDRGYLRISSEEFKNFQRAIWVGNAFLRADFGRAKLWVIKRGGGGHYSKFMTDRRMMDNYKTKSLSQRQALAQSLTTPGHQAAHDSRPEQRL